MSVPLWAWLIFVGLVLALLFLDLFVFHREARAVSFKESIWLTSFWIVVSLAFGGVIWYWAGTDGAVAYLAAYLIEKSLSMDNVFVFSVNLHQLRRTRTGPLPRAVLRSARSNRVSRDLRGWRHRLALGLQLALVFVFGAFFVFTGLRMFRGSGREATPQNNRALRLFRRFLPVTEDYHGDHFFVRTHGRRCATPLLAAVVIIESTDVIFAVDSVSAVLAVTQTTFVAYSSIVFAVLG